MLDELLNRYAEQFDDNFPIFAVRELDEGEVILAVQKCLDENKPYEPNYHDAVDY